MKKHYTITLTDLSPHMLALSQKQNPDCEHHPGDMRTLRLNQQFDAVFIHDAIDYMSTFDDLKSAIETAAVHCKAGGVVMIVPDHIRETFSAYTDHGGNDHPHSMRYLEWTWQPDPESHTVIVDFAYIIRDDEGTDVRVVHDRHICGLFSKAEWVSAFEAAGLEVELIESPVEGVGESVQQVFVARKFK